MIHDMIIIGAGASGLMCGMTAARKGKRVLVLEHNDRSGQKILVSGGGRCNFSNENISAENYISQNPDFCRSALSRFKTEDILKFLDAHKIQYVKEAGGEFFCKGSARLIHSALVSATLKAGAKIVTGCGEISVSKEDHFSVRAGQKAFSAKALVVATGGISYPKLGASGIGHKIAAGFGINVTELRPGLVPFVMGETHSAFCRKLAGISFEVEATCNRKRFKGAMLFTHTGLSGPAMLQLSLYWDKGLPISIDALPDVDIATVFERERTKGNKVLLKNFLSGLLPRRFVESWCELQKIEQRPLCAYSEKGLRDISALLKAWQLRPTSTEGYDIAEVTVGGVDTKGISSKTFESLKVPGLYFIGEVLDVTGELGGYNLHWAWASGHAAGMAS